MPPPPSQRAADRPASRARSATSLAVATVALVGVGLLIDTSLAARDARSLTLPVAVLVVAGLAGAVVVALGAARTQRVARADERTRRLLAAVVDSLDDGVIVRDADGRLLLANPAATHITGLSLERMSAEEVAVASDYHRDGRLRAEMPSLRARRTGEVVRDEVGRIRRPDGSHRWIRTSSQPGVELEPGEVVAVTSLRDITAERDARDALAEAEERFRLTFEGAPIGMALTTPDGIIAEANAAFCSLVARDPAQVRGLHVRELGHPDDVDAATAPLTEMAHGGPGHDGPEHIDRDVRLRRPDGSVVWAAVHVAPVRGPDGRLQHYLVQAVDLSDRKRLEEVLTEAASNDPLTGLPNRRVLSDRLEMVRARASRLPDRMAALLFTDLDGFKVVNDTHGHDVGDAVLIAVAERLRAAVRESDTVARIGGDEFVVLVDEVDEDDDLEALVTRIRRAVEAPLSVGELRLHPALSIGVHVYAPAGISPAEALRIADARMYQVKRARQQEPTLILDLDATPVVPSEAPSAGNGHR